MIKFFKIMNNEACPCKSGKRYNNCCKKKPPQKFKTLSQKEALINKIDKKSKIRTCIIDDCDTKAKDVIMAHAIQKNRILKKIACDGKVLTPNFEENPTLIDINGKLESFHFLEEVDIRKATVYSCFCSKHDNDVFKPIEKEKYSFEILTNEQKFIFAFRTFSFEYYKDLSVIKFYEMMCKEFPEALRKLSFVYKYRNARIKIDELEYYNALFNEKLKKKEYDDLYTHTMKIPYKIGITGYMSVAPPFDLKGKRVKGLIGRNKLMKRMFITIFPDSNYSYILFSCLKADLDVYQDYFNSLETSDIKLVLNYLNLFIPIYSENLVMSPALYDSYDEKGKAILQTFAGEASTLRISQYLSALQDLLKKIEKNESKIKELDENPYNLFLKMN